MAWVNRTIIVTAANAPLARALVQALVGTSGGTMFTVPLAPTAAGPATHYVSSGAIDQQFDAMLRDADLMFAACTQAGAAVALEQCQALATQSIVQDVAVEPPLATIKGAGLVLMEPSA